jgi:tripartite-type tricarboxylate transporter receptor subunit TctC
MWRYLSGTIALACAGTAAFIYAGAASAQEDYPNRPVRIIVPWPPGQATDLAGRVMAQKLAELLGQQIVIDNRAGAGGMIGTDVAMETAMQSPDVREKLFTVGVELDYRRTDEFTRYLADQSTRYADIIKKGNIKIE